MRAGRASAAVLADMLQVYCRRNAPRAEVEGGTPRTRPGQGGRRGAFRIPQLVLRGTNGPPDRMRGPAASGGENQAARRTGAGGTLRIGTTSAGERSGLGIVAVELRTAPLKYSSRGN